MEPSNHSNTAVSEANDLCDGYLFKKLAQAGLIWLDQNHQHVNQLNVFPVPDGDTGTNMLLTMREAYEQIDDLDEPHAGKVAALVADGALNGARGNSGTILSQIWRGLAVGLQGHGAFDAETFAEACKRAVEHAYAAVQTPTEGTILTVAREAAAGVEAAVADGERDLVVILKRMLAASRASLRRTPELLPVLKQAGVVDSGGQGLVFMFEGMAHYLSGKTLVAPPTPELSQPVMLDDWQQALEPEDNEGYGYDVQFRMHGSNLDLEAVRRDIENMGWSACVVGSEKLIKVHVHVHDPGKPISYAIAQGVDIDDVVVENMQLQYQEYVRQRQDREAVAAEFDPSAVAAIAVAPGKGLRRLFLEDLGAARVISGGQTMNPSTGDFLEAIRSLPNKEIILLPNNKNIILAAQQAANAVQDRRVRVVPSRTLPQGISAMLALGNLPSCDNADEAADEMKESLHHVVSAEVTTATRSVEIGGVSVREGQLIGLLEGNLVVAGEDMTDVMRDLLRKAEADKHELITLYFGSDTHKQKAQALVDLLSAEFPDQTFEIVFGGQSLYPYIISIE
jgi:DAK2 domain fusion protein YloV